MGICNKDVVHEKIVVLDDKGQDSQYIKGEAKLISSEEDIKKLSNFEGKQHRFCYTLPFLGFDIFA